MFVGKHEFPIRAIQLNANDVTMRFNYILNLHKVLAPLDLESYRNQLYCMNNSCNSLRIELKIELACGVPYNSFDFIKKNLMQSFCSFSRIFFFFEWTWNPTTSAITLRSNELLFVLLSTTKILFITSPTNRFYFFVSWNIG